MAKGLVAKNTGKQPGDALAAFVAAVGKYDQKTGKSPQKTEWDKYFQVVDVTAENTGIVMNRFYDKFHVLDQTSNTLMYAKTYAGNRYKFADGTFMPDGKQICLQLHPITIQTVLILKGKKQPLSTFLQTR